MSYFLCFLLLGLVASGLWVVVITFYHFFDFSFHPGRNQFQRFARSLSTAIRQTLLVNNGQWIVFATMTMLAFIIGIAAQFARPTILTQGSLEIRQEISKQPFAQKAFSFIWEGNATEYTKQEKAQLEEESKELYSGSGFAFLPWLTCACVLLIWTFAYFFFAISDEVAEVARKLAKRLGHHPNADNQQGQGMLSALRDLWHAHQVRQQQQPSTTEHAPTGTSQNPILVQPSLLTVAGMAISTDFLFAFIEHLWHAISHRRV